MKLAEKFGHIQSVFIYKPDDKWPIPDCRMGLEWEWEQAESLALALNRTKGAKEYLSVKTDGSLRDQGYEIVTVGDGLFGKDLTCAIEEMDRLVKACPKGTPVCNYRTAFHAHIDVRDMEAEEVHNMLFLYSLLEHPLFEWVGNDREFNNFCVPWYRADGILDAFRSMANPDAILVNRVNGMQRYAALNVQSISKYGTIEFRHMQNSTDEILTRQVEFIKFAMRLKQLAISLHREGIKGVDMYAWAKAANPLDLCRMVGFCMPAHPDWDYVESLMQGSQMFEFPKSKMDHFIDNYFVPFFGKHANWR